MTAHEYDRIVPPRDGAVRVRIAQEPGIEVELGHQGIGVFLGVLARRGGRYLTVSLGEDGARRLARRLVQAADASAAHRAGQAGPHTPEPGFVATETPE